MIITGTDYILDTGNAMGNILRMTLPSIAAPSRSARCPLGRYTPCTHSMRARWRFGRDRRARYLTRIIGDPTDAQAALIESLIKIEWAAIVAEHDGSLPALRDAREHRRLFQRLLGDFERSITASPQLDRLAEIMAAMGDNG